MGRRMRIPLAVVGMSHQTAPVEIRERLAYGPEESDGALLELWSRARVKEAVLLSTCNRTEVYLFPAEARGSVEAAADVLSTRAGSIEGFLFRKWGDAAVRHLFEVTAGMDSLVTGESEIQGQVRDAYQRAVGLRTDPSLVGPVLSRLFEGALAVGGRVRSETPIAEGAASVASVAIELARKIFGTLKGKRVLILGAGVTGERIMDALAREGVQSVMVANRTYDRAVRLASKHRGHAIPLGQIQEVLPGVDIVLSSTAAPHPVLTRTILAESFPEPRRHPLLIIDVAMPRDVDPAVGDEPEVFLYNVDDLRRIVDEHVELRAGALPEAQRIIAGEADAFRAWYASLQVVPVIQRIRDQGEEIRETELERLFNKSELSPEDRRRVEEFARRLQNKLLHTPTSRLRRGLTEGGGSELIDAVRFLYGLDTEESEAGVPRVEGEDPERIGEDRRRVDGANGD